MFHMSVIRAPGQYGSVTLPLPNAFGVVSSTVCDDGVVDNLPPYSTIALRPPKITCPICVVKSSNEIFLSE